MEQEKVVDAIKAILGEDPQADRTGNNSNYQITINGNVTITVHPPSDVCPSPQASTR